MLLVLWTVVVGVCLGAVLASSQAPRGGWLEAAAGTALALSGAAVLVAVPPGGALAGVAYALSVPLSYVLFSGRAWRRALPRIDRPYLWFVRMAATRRGDLRRMLDADEVE
jgi:hypothetical protein